MLQSFTTEGEQKEDGTMSASVKAKLGCKPIGLVLEEKWNNKNAIEVKATVADQGVKGLTVETKGKFEEKAGKNPLTGHIETAFANEAFSGALKLVSEGSIVDKVEVSAAAGAQGFIAGAGAKLAVATNNLSDVDFKLGYIGSNFRANVVMGSLFSKFAIEYLQVVSPKVSVAVQMKLESAFPTIEIGSTYACNPDTLIRSRVHTNGKIGAVLEQKFSPAVKVSWCGQIDAAAGFSSGKMGSFGTAIEFEA